jgi:uncharacterized membrane protein
MVKKIYETLKPMRFRLAIIGLLGMASLVSVALFRLRTALSGTMEYDFLLWNLFLAWLPLAMAYTASTFAQKRRFVALTVPFAAALWLLFFPNAPYILTDLFHLRHPREVIPVWYDTLLINWFAWTGILLGIFSLFIMHDIVRRAFGRVTGWVFVAIVGSLCGVGIYIGRFLRWNSWDILFHPIERLKEFAFYATHPSLQSIIFITVFSSLFIFIYISTYTFGLLFQEHARQDLS